jgi:hypothetical protein
MTDTESQDLNLNLNSHYESYWPRTGSLPVQPGIVSGETSQRVMTRRFESFGDFWGLGSMCGHLENAEKLNTEITQPLKKLPLLMWLLSTSRARYRAFLKHLYNNTQAFLKHF